MIVRFGIAGPVLKKSILDFVISVKINRNRASLAMNDIGLVCPTCGYNLTALTKPVCPECGARIGLTPYQPEFALGMLVCRCAALWLTIEGIFRLGHAIHFLFILSPSPPMAMPAITYFSLFLTPLLAFVAAVAIWTCARPLAARMMGFRLAKLDDVRLPYESVLALAITMLGLATFVLTMSNSIGFIATAIFLVVGMSVSGATPSAMVVAYNVTAIFCSVILIVGAPDLAHRLARRRKRHASTDQEG